jgi:hypothetical protein
VEELFKVTLVNLAVGEAVRFLKVPAPLISCAFVEAENETVELSTKVEFVKLRLVVDVKIPPLFTVRLPLIYRVAILDSPPLLTVTLPDTGC